MTERRKIRWLIAHYPAYLFVRTAEVFRNELEKLCPGEFDLEIHTFDSYVKQYNKLDEMMQHPPEIPTLEEPSLAHPEFKGRELADFKQVRSKWESIFNALKDGEFEMSQTQVNIVGTYLKSDYNALDLPYLFNDHDHVTRVLDGHIGDKLGAGLAESHGIRGLGFTYSGGYRVIGANKEITKLTDLNDLTFLTTTGPSKFLFDEIGVAPLDKAEAGPSDHGDIQQDGGAIETTYLRFTGKHVLKTDHSIFMTTILTGTKFFDSLTPAQQDAFTTAAKTVAKIERIWSVEDADKYEKQAQENGITIVELSDEDKARLRHASKQSYKQLMKMKINPQIVDAILRDGKK